MKLNAMKNVIITGASSGIGRNLAQYFIDKGANVFLIGRDEQRLLKLINSNKQNSNVYYQVCNICDKNEVEQAVKKYVQKFFTAEVLINCAGITSKATVTDMNEENWSRVIDTNLNGTANMCSQVIPLMEEQKYGRIINISSFNASFASMTVPRHSYNASKAAVLGLTKGLAATYMSKGIVVNAVCPGLFESEMTKELFENRIVLSTYNRHVPAGRPGKSDELNGLIDFLSSEECSYITGQVIFADGGLSCASYL